MIPLIKHVESSDESEKYQVDDNFADLKGIDEASVWAKFKSGSQSAFVYIYNTYFDKLLNIGCQMTQDKSLVKDCIQDLFIDLMNRRTKLGDVKSIKLYLYKSFRRKILKYIQFDRKKQSKEDNAELYPYLLEISQEEVMIATQLHEHQKGKIAKGISILSDKEREAIYYFYFHNLSYKEICEIFNYSQVKTARTLIYQALKKLRSFIATVIWLSFLLYFN